MFSYKPLFKTMIDKNIKNKEQLRQMIGVSTRTMARINKDIDKSQYVSMEVLDKICTALDVPIEKVIEHVKK